MNLLLQGIFTVIFIIVGVLLLYYLYIKKKI